MTSGIGIMAIKAVQHQHPTNNFFVHRFQFALGYFYSGFWLTDVTIIELQRRHVAKWLCSKNSQRAPLKNRAQDRLYHTSCSLACTRQARNGRNRVNCLNAAAWNCNTNSELAECRTHFSFMRALLLCSATRCRLACLHRQKSNAIL